MTLGTVRRARLTVAACLTLLTACGSVDDATAGGDRAASAGPQGAAGGSETAVTGELSGELTVLAAASLTEVFRGLAEDLETGNPGLDVRLSFGASSELAAQVLAGAPADVLATANSSTMELVVEDGLTSDTPAVFAANVLQLAVPPDNPGQVDSLEDLANPDLTVALCAVEVPCGAAAAALLHLAGVAAEPDTLEPDVRSALTKVELGEVDAALVYRTDVLAAGDAVLGIEVPGSERVVSRYPIAALVDAPNPSAAAAFVSLVLSPAGLAALEDAGFRAP